MDTLTQCQDRRFYGMQKCKCCDAYLHQIDPEDICMDCVDMGCNVKDENNA